MVGDELPGILVGGDQYRFPLRFFRAFCDGRQQVIRLKMVLFEPCNAEGVEETAGEERLRAEVVRHLGTIRLIERVEIVPKGFSGAVEGGEKIIRLKFQEDIHGVAYQTERRAGRLPFGPGHFAHSVKNLVEYPVNVENKDAFSAQFGRFH